MEPPYQSIRTIELQYGRQFTWQDEENGTRIAIVGHDMARQLFGNRYVLGEQLMLNGLPYTVAAIRAVGDYPRVKQALQRARYSELLAQLGRLAVDTRDPDVLLAQVPQVAVEALRADFAAVLLLEPDGLAFRVASGVNLIAGQGVGDLEPNRRDTLPGQVLLQGRPIVIGDDPRTPPVSRVASAVWSTRCPVGT